ncbi:hypothetical protein PS15p_202298 [Mucor circinelloides]
MQYLTSRNMSSIATPKIHKMGNNTPTAVVDSTPWMQSSSSSTAMTDQYYSSSSHTSPLLNSDNDNMYLSESNTKSHRSRTSTSDMCVEKNTEGKPPYSYATLIKYAIERSAENKLTLSQIYQWVIDHYPYYGSAGSGWKNSIRHNLSLNKSFVRVPRPVNEPGKGSYWTVDQFAVDTEQRMRSNVRGRSSRSSSDTSLHHHHHRNSNDPWLLGAGLRHGRDGRSLSTDAGNPSCSSSSSSSSAAAAAAAAAQAAAAQAAQAAATSAPTGGLARRVSGTSRYGYYSHPYMGYGDMNQQTASYNGGYPNYHYQQPQQRMPSHETLLSARQHSSVTYSLPATATTTNQSCLNNFSNNTNNNNMYSLNNSMHHQQQPFYSHRQSCPDLTSISHSETNMLPNFNTASAAASYNTPSFYMNESSASSKFISSGSTSPCPVKGGGGGGGASQQPVIYFDTTKDVGTTHPDAGLVTPNTSSTNSHGLPASLPSPVLSSSTSPSSSSQHLSVADPLSMVTQQQQQQQQQQHPSPVTTTTSVATSVTPGNRLAPSYFSLPSDTATAKDECLTSPSSPLVMTDL